jgi:hypothetical protein
MSCRCRPPDRREAVRSADLILFGVVDSVLSMSEARTLLVLHTIRSWKGSLPSTTQVNTMGTCRYVARPGEHHVLFLKKRRSGGLETSICSGNASGPEVEKVIGELDKRFDRGRLD